VGIFLGIDGGGSKTTCVLGDETSILATATTGASNIVRVGEAEAREALQQAVREVCAAAQIEPAQVGRACVGLAGADRRDVSEAVQAIMSEIIPGTVEVVGDMTIAFEEAFAGGPGVIVISGTGSIAYGRNLTGQTARAGGWGFEVSDEGSGQWIGRTAVSAVLRAQDEDEAAPTTLAMGILKAWGLHTLDELIRTANGTPAPDFSELFLPVLAAADAGDPVARTVLTEAGTELARLAKIVIGRIFAEESSVPVAMSGGVFRHSALVRQVFYNSLRSEYPNATVANVVVEPVNGALALARKRGAAAGRASGG
jgi:glucosamine kinase